MACVEEVLRKLRAEAKPENVAGMASYGMSFEGRLGVAVPSMRKIAKSVGMDHHLALALWETGIAEARIVASMIDDAAMLTEEQMEEWVRGLNSWDVCDQVCMNLFEKTPLAWKKIADWSAREEEFVRRAAFALLACLAWHDKQAADAQFAEFFHLIKRTATDERKYVKKAVNWALRNIGKRNRALNQAALVLAQEIQGLGAKSARWIGADAIKELTSEAVQERLAR
jgi:3-methyladenine DNA glycosylase AlkD